MYAHYEQHENMYAHYVAYTYICICTECIHVYIYIYNMYVCMYVCMYSTLSATTNLVSLSGRLFYVGRSICFHAFVGCFNSRWCSVLNDILHLFHACQCLVPNMQTLHHLLNVWFSLSWVREMCFTFLVIVCLRFPTCTRPHTQTQ